MEPQQPRRQSTAPDNLSAAIDRATTAHEAAILAGDPNLIIITGDELRRLEDLIPESNR